MSQINITTARTEELQLIKNCKDRYLILSNYVDDKKGNIREACRAHNWLVDRVLKIIELHKRNVSECEKDNAEDFGSWFRRMSFEASEYNVPFDGFEEELLKRLVYVPGKVKSIRKKLKAGLKNIHSTIEMILLDIHVIGCFGKYVFWEESLELYDPVEEERKHKEYEAKLQEEERIRQLLDAPACSEKAAYLQEHAERKTYVDKAGQERFYFKYKNRLYDPDGTRFGYSEILKRGIKDEM